VEQEQWVSLVDFDAAAVVVVYYQLLILLYAFLPQHSIQKLKPHRSLIAGVIGSYCWNQTSPIFAVFVAAAFAAVVLFFASTAVVAAVGDVAPKKLVYSLRQPM
jgi:uncharacterized BrkB/YihY/UPF0761 family membrane protein